jgi:hypothetical protein
MIGIGRRGDVLSLSLPSQLRDQRFDVRVQTLELLGDLGHRRLVEAVAHPGLEEIVARHQATFSRRLSIVCTCFLIVVSTLARFSSVTHAYRAHSLVPPAARAVGQGAARHLGCGGGDALGCDEKTLRQDAPEGDVAG